MRLEALFERHRSVQTAGFGSDAYKPGLEAMRDYASFLGNPQEKLRCIVHVAGTNGKGSVSSMLAAALSSQGLKTALYTSPHLVDFRERMKIVCGGTFRMIPEEYVCRFLDEKDRDGLSFFEITTGLAFAWFASENVDAAVIETGLGGRLDSTNIIVPSLSVITSIGLDHCALLGGTRAEIAAEKAGIFKPGVPALVWGRDAETAPVFERIAASVGAPLHFAEDFPLPDDCPPASGLDVAGPFSGQNLRTVAAALSLLDSARPAAQDLPAARHCAGGITAVAHAARITGLRGRWEQLSDSPTVICDIGHNPQALEASFAKLRDMAGGRRLLVVYGVMADKDIDSIARLFPREAEYFLVAPDTPRALPVEALALKLKSFAACGCASVGDGVQKAMERAAELSSRGLESLIFIGGSTFVVSEAMIYLECL